MRSVTWSCTARGDGSIQFEDANSTNGSYLVEGDKLVRISSTYLQPEACLQLGKVQVLLAEIMQNILTKIRQDREAEK
jgi:pSer/pThr/pTyr-binding forkhead associated (FHA) protein